MTRKSIASAVSLAWLVNIDGWIAVSDGQSGGSEYFLKIPPAFVLEETTILTTAAVAIVLLWGITALDQRARWGHVVRDMLLIVGTCFGGFKLLVYVARAVPWVGGAMQVLFGGGNRYQSFAVILIVTGLLVFGLVYRRRTVARIAEGALVLAVPLVLTNTVIVSWTLIRLGYRTDYSDRRAAAALSARKQAGTRLVWVIFDEMDQALTFEQRPRGLKLPELDRLRSTSLVATNAKPAGSSTLLSVPSLTTGRQVRLAIPKAVDALELEFLDDAQRRTWRDSVNVFTAAHSMRMNTALVGWYHPYCRVFGDLLASCYWLPVLDVGNHLRRRAFADTLGIRSYLFPYLRDVLGMRSLLDPAGITTEEGDLVHQSHAAINAAIWEKSLSVVADSRFDFVFIHVPLPHPPGLRAVGGALLESTSSCYIENFRLVDALIGEWRSALEHAGLWENSALIVTSDHSLREFWQAQPFWTEADGKLVGASDLDTVPLLVKMPRQNRGAEISEPIGTELLYELAVGILRGDFSNTDRVSAWLRTRATQCSNLQKPSLDPCTKLGSDKPNNITSAAEAP